MLIFRIHLRATFAARRVLERYHLNREAFQTPVGTGRGRAEVQPVSGWTGGRRASMLISQYALASEASIARRTLGFTVCERERKA